MNVDQGSDRCPVIQPLGIGNGQVDATMTHGRPKITVPISAMQPITFVEVHGVRYVWQGITWSAHGCGTIFDINVILAGNSGVLPRPGGNDKRIDDRIPIE